MTDEELIKTHAAKEGGPAGSEYERRCYLGNWPVQIRLVPSHASCFDKATLLITGDCVPFAFAAFHERFARDRTVLVGCPKLDDAHFYLMKLAQIFIQNEVMAVEVLYMEVPCCFGMPNIVSQAIAESGKSIPLTLYKISISGEIMETEGYEDGGAL